MISKWRKNSVKSKLKDIAQRSIIFLEIDSIHENCLILVYSVDTEINIMPEANLVKNIGVEDAFK